MTSPLDVAKFIVELAKDILNEVKERKQTKSENLIRASEFLRGIADALREYGVLLESEQEDQRNKAIEQRSYLEMLLKSMPYAFEGLVEDDLLDQLLHRLKEAKVTDGQLVLEVSALVEGVEEADPAERTEMIRQIYRAAGEYRAAAEMLESRGGGK